MQLWMLVAYNTENSLEARYRVYTSSPKRARAFAKIPKIQFTDSGHGIVFAAREVPQKTLPEIYGRNSVRDHVVTHASRDASGKKLEWK